MKPTRPAWAAVIVFLASVPPAGAVGTANVDARLVAGVAAIRAGESFPLAVVLKMAPGWHTYWKNSGGSGRPTTVVITLPDFFQASQLRWPIPERFQVAGLSTLGYEGEVALLTTITPSAELPRGKFSVMAQVAWVECKDICIPGKATLSLALPSTTTQIRPDPAPARFFASANRFLPRADPELRARYEVIGAGVELTVGRPSGLGERLDFFPDVQGWIDLSAPPKIRTAARGAVLRFKRAAGPLPPGDLNGVLVMGQGVGRKGLEISAKLAEVKAH